MQIITPKKQYFEEFPDVYPHAVSVLPNEKGVEPYAIMQLTSLSREDMMYIKIG